MAGNLEREATEPPKPSTVTKSRGLLERRKLAPKATAKRLPWLDGKSSPAQPAIRSIPKASHAIPPVPDSEALPSPSKPFQNNQPTSSPLSKDASSQFLGANPTIRAIGSTPSLRRKFLNLSLQRRMSFIRASSPFPVTKKRFSQMSRHSNLKISSRSKEKSSHLPHLEPFITPESVLKPVQRNIRATMPQPVMKSAQISPTKLVPRRNPFERARDRRLSNAIEGLGDLIQEAVDVAEDAADQGQVEEVYDVIKGATNAIHRASAIPARHLMATGPPLSVSESSEEPPNQSEDSVMTTPPRFYGDQTRNSVAIDWAFNNFKSGLHRRSSASPLSDTDDSITKRRYRFSTRSDLLLPPEPAQNANREHVDFVMRSFKPRNSSRGGLRRRRTIESDLDGRRPRHKTGFISCSEHSRPQPLLGIMIGIYAGEVPRIQYMLADEHHHIIIGKVVLYFGIAILAFIAWPLPLLHGRKPYILAALALALPLQFPQAIVVGAKRSPNNPSFRVGLLLSRAFSGIILGFANVNFVSVLLDLFDASLQSKRPHQEIAVVNDVRRYGIWPLVGAGIIEDLIPDWGFYIVVILPAAVLVLNILAPGTRHSVYRKSVSDVYDRDQHFITRRVSRGEVKLHISTGGLKYWFGEVWAGMELAIIMMCQVGFSVLAFYLGWIYAQIVLVIVLLGAILSRDYKRRPPFVGLGVLSITIGALLAVPVTKAGIFPCERKTLFRTDSMTFQKQSHMYMVPIVFAGAVGFLSELAIAECYGLIMETLDTCDLQPGVNTKHRLQSMTIQDRRRRTYYSSFPHVTAGIFASHTLAFIGAAVATEVGGIMTRHIGAQASTGVTAGILLGLTILLTVVLWRLREVQVIPSHAFGRRRDTKAWEEFQEMGKADWKPVVIGNPSGKMRMSVLELGDLSRWTEIMKLNFLIRESRDEKGRKRISW
ncbi:hypothetical protein K469DRAFT_742430 [Zopfia rhizophila CBS 207.26]|uniref:MFS general substrate transporter n=1 Tax=Zopfia rhizophila CBS 207.26 TaxID=1314779 RepID=A0A6A6DGW1_9PEZI|nr:hypothetical protein K469DRAFT_742430 [Zopfia rhizophila CBS 207.26]